MAEVKRRKKPGPKPKSKKRKEWEASLQKRIDEGVDPAVPNKWQKRSIMSIVGTDPDAIQQAVASAYTWSMLPEVQSDEECAERLNYFFKHSAETGDLPTVEKLALALGCDRWKVDNWYHGQGCSQDRMEMMRKARTIMAALDAELASKQKISPVTYIFRAKNFYDMRDQTERIVTNISATAQDAERLFDNYADVIDADFTEEDNKTGKQ